MAEVYLTETGYKEKQERLNYLKNTLRVEVTEEIKVARGFGDLSENAEYHAAKKKQEEIDGEIAELEEMLAVAKIIQAVEVEFCEMDAGGKELPKKSYKIVGTAEADLSKGCISDESPIGKALLSAKAGETVSVTLPTGRIKNFKVLNVKR